MNLARMLTSYLTLNLLVLLAGAGMRAGFWMFIKSTALNYGLRVDGEVDERLNEALETDAAMRLLTANRMRFNDLRLSVMAYAIGESAVQKYMDQTHSRDPWVLTRKAGGEHYLAELMAAILIMRNPGVVQ